MCIRDSNQASISSSSQNKLLASISQQTSYEKVSNNVILVPTTINNSQPQTASAGSNIVATMSNDDILRTYHNGVVNNAMYKVG